jgi:rhodanese-related sulfurtransferase
VSWNRYIRKRKTAPYRIDFREAKALLVVTCFWRWASKLRPFMVLSHKPLLRKPYGELLMPTISELVEQAEEQIECLSVAEVQTIFADDNVTMIDARDIREIWREGRIPGAYHMPRGMTEFWVDKTSPYFKDMFENSSQKFVFYCNKGWRSALAGKAAHDVGLENVAHMRGGFTEWCEAGGTTETVEKK